VSKGAHLGRTTHADHIRLVYLHDPLHTCRVSRYGAFASVRTRIRTAEEPIGDKETMMQPSGYGQLQRYAGWIDNGGNMYVRPRVAQYTNRDGAICIGMVSQGRFLSRVVCDDDMPLEPRCFSVDAEHAVAKIKATGGKKIVKRNIGGERTTRDDKGDGLTDWEREHPYFQAQRAAAAAAAAAVQHPAVISSVGRAIDAPGEAKLKEIGSFFGGELINKAFVHIVEKALTDCDRSAPSTTIHGMPREVREGRGEMEYPIDNELLWRALPAKSRHWLKRRSVTRMRKGDAGAGARALATEYRVYQGKKPYNKLFELVARVVQERLQADGLGFFSLPMLRDVLVELS